MIIDCHCHAGLGDGFRGPWDTEAPIAWHLDRARRAGIEMTVVFPVFNSDYANANRRLARIIDRYPNELIGFCSVNPVRDAGRANRIIGEAVERFGFRGIKVHGMDSFPGREVCEAARRHAIPMLVDVVRKVSAVEMLACQYPDVDLIVPHLGGFMDDWSTHLRVIDQLCRHPRVYADTSGVRYWESIRLAVQRAGPTKVLFGTDGPQLHPSVELHKIKVLGLTSAQEQLITGGNIARILRLSDTEPRSAMRRRGHTAGSSSAF